MPAPRTTPSCFAKALLLAVVVAGQPALAQEPAERLLQSKGLLKLGTGAVWITPSEAELRRHLAVLDTLRGKIQNTERALDERINQNRARHATLQNLQTALKSASGDAQKRAIQKRIKAIEATTVDPEKLAAAPDVQSQLIELSTDRTSLQLKALAIRRLAPRLTGEYTALMRDGDVAAALRQTGGGARLGPARDYASDLRRLRDYERLVLTDAVPLYLQSGLPRLCAVVDDRAAVTFTWDKTGGPIIITSSMARRTGLQVPDDAPRRALKIGRRSHEAARITVERLRLGRHVLRNVEVFILPPEGEDLGARIGQAALGELKSELQLDQLRLLIGTK